LEAQAEPGDGLTLVVSTFPEAPRAEETWTVTILADYPHPEDMTVSLPELPPSLVLEQVRKEPRYTNRDERWTVCEMRFRFRRGGEAILPPIEVRVPGYTARTESLRVYAVGTAPGERPLEESVRLIRECDPPRAIAGEAAQIVLRLSGPDQTPLSAVVSFPSRMDIPENALLEALPLSESDREGGVLFRWRLIPLAGPTVYLAPLDIRYEGTVVTVPALAIPVLPERNAAAIPDAPAGPVSGAEAAPGDDGPLENTPIPFPDLPAGVFFLFRHDYEEAAESARTLWEGGLRAEAIASLRRAERDSSAGPALIPLRRALEAALFPGLTADEQWRPRTLLRALCAGSLTLLLTAVLAFLFRRKSAVTSGLSWGYKSIGITLLIILGLSIYALAGAPHTGGVLRAAEGYRLPEETGPGWVRFSEGQSAAVHSRVKDWVYVETPDGKAGWVSAGRVILY
jgi:hypothetical protein